MNGMVRSSFKLTSSSSFMNVFRQTIKPENAKQRLYSTFWNTCLKSAEIDSLKTAALWNKRSYAIKQYATTKTSDSELAKFLEDEISAEEQLQKTKTIPSKIDDFEVKLNGSEVTLIKTLPGETIEISFNINHSVGPNESLDEEMNEEEYTEIKSKPVFEIDIKRGDQHLGFTCSFAEEEPPQEGDEMAGDLYVIDEVTLYKGEWKDTNYSVSASILDGSLYDLLMNFLDEKGITSDFVFKLSELSTAYEHSSYITLLRDLKKFASS